jgi:hypothetical protein
MRLQAALLAIMLTIPAAGAATIRPVPGSYSSIQSAILAAETGDTVLVEHGRYVENINFLGKDITVAGRYMLSKDPADIVATVIDGSAPAHPDTASCVLIVSGEGPQAVLEGFTITGGTGTKWLDEHGAGLFCEGGGILITLSSPVIRHNYILRNEAVNAPGQSFVTTSFPRTLLMRPSRGNRRLVAGESGFSRAGRGMRRRTSWRITPLLGTRPSEPQPPRPLAGGEGWS